MVYKNSKRKSLSLSMQAKNFNKQHLEIFFLFFPEKIFDISCKLFPMERICMKCQILFSGKNKKNSISSLSTELA